MLPTLVEQLATDTTGVSLPAARPEVALCATIVAMLLSRLIPGVRRLDAFWIALAGVVTAAGLLVAEASGGLAAIERTELFTGLLVQDPLGVYARGLLLVFALLFVPLVRITGLANRHDGQDLYTLVLGALVGMCLMARANHLVTVFIGIEMASVPSYVLAGIVKGRRRAGEAALKYSVYGAAAAGVMLYGVSLLAGVLGTAHLPTMGARAAALVASPGADAAVAQLTVLALGATLLLVGMAFKLSAAPFHFWAPDVFAGAPAEIGGFLSTASKAAALVLMVRLLAAAAPHNAMLAEDQTSSLAASVALVSTADSPAPSKPAAASNAAETGAAAATGDPIRRFLTVSLAMVAIATCTLGNLAAFGQKNAKRLLAYSTIAHAGYLLMPLAAAVRLAREDPTAADAAVGAMLFYATGYLFLNLTAFAVVALVRNHRGTEQLDDYAGLGRSAPLAAGALAIAALGLLGLPPLVGFFGKFAMLRSVVEASGPLMTALLVTALLNTAASVFYYLRLVKLAVIERPNANSAAVDRGPMPPLARTWLVVCGAPIVVLGLFPEVVASLASAASSGLFR
ncbi:MAG: NADH-quinone oxidoreductase subunit N [Planctomycetota bacterium]